MPKLKTRKCISKRVKRTGTGKYKYFKAGRRHLMTGKSGKRKRHLRKDGILQSSNMKRIAKAMPYG
ncbi:MAG: 50S ribosomal protein L35 [Lentisphaerae bacterium ADurb.Bin242]|nr:MAG: 50S ribosomal protein L35 [Lentisphaerae bacterium ADurb.Bin242]